MAVAVATSKATFQLHHLAIEVRDGEIEAAARWLAEMMGAEIAWSAPDWAMIHFEDQIDVALVRPGQDPPHIGFTAPDAALYGRLKEHRDGTSSVYIYSPGGLVIEAMVPINEDD